MLLSLRKLAALGTLSFIATLPACEAPVGAGSPSKVPSDAREQCVAHCNRAAMQLDAVAIMAGRVGCICRDLPGTPGRPHADAPGSPSRAEGPGISAGMATIAIMEDEETSRKQTNPTRK